MRDGNVGWCVGAGPRKRAWLIEAIAFGLFLVLAGTLLAIPGRHWAQFTLGLGGILLGKNFARHLNGLRMRRAGVAGGGGALVAGLAGLAAPSLPLFAIFLVVTGGVVLGLAVLDITTHP